MSYEDNFYAITLNSENKKITWDVKPDSKDYPSPFYKLIIRQILLGHQAKEEEFNVVQVETTSILSDVPSGQYKIKVPVAVLKAGETRSIQTVLEFPDMPVTFELIEGNGPVYIHGLQVPGNYELETAEGLVGEEEEDDEEDEEEAKEKVKNAKNAVNKNGKKK